MLKCSSLTATYGSAEWPAEIAWYAAEMHRSWGISSPYTEECARYDVDMRMICCGSSFKEMTGREKLHFHLTCSQERVGEEGQALFFVLRRTIFSQHVRLILYLFSQHWKQKLFCMLRVSEWEIKSVKEWNSFCLTVKLRHCFKYRRSLSEWDSNGRGRKFAAA